MFNDSVRCAFRTMARHRVYSAITVIGLAIGMACCLLILVSIADELRYDTWHANANRIFRVAGEYRVADRTVRVAVTPGPLGPVLETVFPEVQDAVRLWKSTNPESMVIEAEGKRFSESRVIFSDPDIFQLFSFRLTRGDSDRALLNPFTLVLTESAARRYFGNADPLGAVMTVNLGGPQRCRVAGVMADHPRNSHFRCDFLVSLSTLEALEGYLLTDWRRAEFYTYILLPDEYSPGSLETRFPGMIAHHLQAEEAERVRFFLQPLTSIHLHSHLESELEQNGDVNDIYLFSTIAIFVLFIACINFMNLSTARSTLRLREIAMRKILGANRRSLVLHLIGESMVVSLTSFLLALSLAELLFPVFAALTGERLEIFYYRNPLVMGGLFAASLLVGAAAGIYPAIFLSRPDPGRVLRGVAVSDAASGVRLREILVVIQFAVSAMLIISTGIAAGQLNYLKIRTLGFHGDRILVVSIRGRELLRPYESLKSALRVNPDIQAVAASSAVPGEASISRYEFQPDGASANRLVAMYGIMADRDFLNTYGIDLVRGRNFDESDSGDWEGAFILNEAAVREIGWDDPIGKHLSHGIQGGTVIGVVRDFHFRSMHERIEPLFLLSSRDRFQYLSLRIRPGRTMESLRYLESEWRELAPGAPLEYTFLNENFNRLHRSDQRVGRMFGSFALLSVCIACFGLFGLAAFTAERRTREIGIRKVLGASTVDILRMLAGSFIRLILVSQLIAWPTAYLVMRFWLGSFAYHDGMRASTFLIGGLLTIAIALVTISYQAVRAAASSPADALRRD